jgi:hypothetical protein
MQTWEVRKWVGELLSCNSGYNVGEQNVFGMERGKSVSVAPNLSALVGAGCSFSFPFLSYHTLYVRSTAVLPT